MHKYALIGIFVKLFLGSANYFSEKAINSTCGSPLYDIDKGDKNCPPNETPFKKALFVVFCNVFSLSLCLLIFFFFRRKKVDPEPYRKKDNYLRMLIPGFIESMAFCLSTTARTLMPLSLSMIMKGAKVIFSALFTIVIFRKTLPAFKWIAVGVCFAGLAIAGSSEYMKVFSAGNSATNVLIALAMSLASEAMFAFQVIFDERMMKVRKCDITFVVGMEGLTGVVLLTGIVLGAWLIVPGSQGDAYENLEDTFYRISQSGVIIGLLCFYVCDIFVVAVADGSIIKYLSGVHSSLVSVGRTLVVWLMELIFASCLPPYLAKQYGQTWDNPWSIIKLFGFIIVVVAIFMYDGVVRIPGLDYSTIKKAAAAAEPSINNKPPIESIAGESLTMAPTNDIHEDLEGLPRDISERGSLTTHSCDRALK